MVNHWNMSSCLDKSEASWMRMMILKKIIQPICFNVVVSPSHSSLAIFIRFGFLIFVRCELFCAFNLSALLSIAMNL